MNISGSTAPRARPSHPTTSLPFPPPTHGYSDVTLLAWSTDPAVMKSALRREEELRLCDAQQELFAAVEDRCDVDWIDLAEKLQKRVVREFLGRTISDALNESAVMGRALQIMRTAPQQYPN